jgi:hypothetical protein
MILISVQIPSEKLLPMDPFSFWNWKCEVSERLPKRWLACGSQAFDVDSSYHCVTEVTKRRILHPLTDFQIKKPRQRKLQTCWNQGGWNRFTSILNLVFPTRKRNRIESNRIKPNRTELNRTELNRTEVNFVTISIVIQKIEPWKEMKHYWFNSIKSRRLEPKTKRLQ